MNSWEDFLIKIKKEPFYSDIFAQVEEDEKNGIVIYPPSDLIFEAFKHCPLSKTKVVILGQDPYIKEGQAHGLSFSVKCKSLPPSLRNVFKELKSERGIDRFNGDLTGWAKQGVFLLNSALTVQAGKSNSHASIGWNNLTIAAIEQVCLSGNPVVFILWGAVAKKYQPLIEKFPNVHVILGAHPSPLNTSGGFLGTKPFSKTNNFLISKGIDPIDWSL